MNKSLIMEKITEKVQSEMYSFSDGETDFNVIYDTLVLALYNAKYYRNFVNDNDDVYWQAFCTICNEKHIYASVLNHHKKVLMTLINK